MYTVRFMNVLQTIWWLLVTAQVISAGISCLSNPCLHGICIDDINTTFSCYCVDGYTGVQCQTNWDECWSSPCQNGGTCLDGIASYNCSCPDGFIGDNCETNYNECESNPCLNNGTCIDMNNGYLCSCVPGFSGQHCELDIAVCNTTEEVRCYNGGECVEGPGFKFYCKCSPGWAGSKCEDQIDECASNPCQNGGICIDVHADYMCACAFGYTGKSCEVQIEFCDENSCSNNALCVIEEDIRVCYCVPDFHGERCELQYDECLLGPRCMNGGTCIDGVDNFTCSCPPRLTGSLCECLALNDGTYDCEYVSPTPLTSSTQSVLTSLLVNEETTTEIYVQTEIPTTSTTISSNETTATIKAETTEPEIIATTSTIFRTETETYTSITTEITTDTEVVDVTTTITNTTIATSEGIPTTATTKEEVTEPSDHTETRPTMKFEDAKTQATTITSARTTTGCVGVCDDTLTVIPLTTEVDITTGTTEGVKTEIPATDTTAEIALTTASTITSTILQPDTPDMPTEKQTSFSTSTTSSTSIFSTELTTSKISSTLQTSTTPQTSTSTSTDIMFTDVPTEHPTTDLFTVYSTTEVIEVTSGTENNVMHTYPTTVRSECTDSICNDHGDCINTIHGIRCHCHFKYAGRFCEEKVSITLAAFGGNTFISHRLKNVTSINIEFNAKTLITDGQIMYVDIAKGVYMLLCMDSGLLKFKFSCGYQTMLLSELKTFVNKGYPMKIETKLDLYPKQQHCNATIRLNDTVAMSGGQVANITDMDYVSMLYLGNSPIVKDSENKPFIGCIKDLKVNGESREIFGDAIDAGEVAECLSLSCLSGPCLNGGSCNEHDGGYTCSCANGWLGSHCNDSVCDNNPCQSGGSCVRHPGSGFLCLCPYGKHGIFCEYNVEITRPSLAPISPSTSSYIMYPLSPSAINSDRFDLRLRFQTSNMEQISLLAFVGQNGKHDSRSQHIALTFVKGYIMLTWNMGNGARRIFTSRVLSARRGDHLVRVWRRGRSAGLNIDGRLNVTGNAPAHTTKMTLKPYIYIGGHPSANFADLPHDLPLHGGWVGCIWEVGGAALGAGARAVGGRGVGQCGVAQCNAKSCNAPRGVCIHSPASYGCICNEGWFGATCSRNHNPCDNTDTPCNGQCVITSDGDTQCDCPYGKTGMHCDQELLPNEILFTGIRSYLQLHLRSISTVSLSIEAEIKPTKERGLLLFTGSPHFYTALSLQGGLLEYRWTDRVSGVTSLVRSGVVISMSQWHSVKAGRYGSRLYLWVDGAFSTESMLAHAYPHTASNASIFLGGVKDLSTVPFDAMSGPPECYTGCIKNVHINNLLVPLEQQNIQEGRNVAECESGLGSAACGASCGGACAARCRREARCSAARCRAPAGRCHERRCVCAAGYTGLYCDTKINVTIPQFDGFSLLALGVHNSQTNQQRVAPSLVLPDYVTLNFTTAIPDGLLLWLTMNTDYIGLGFENGYLKLVWSFYPTNVTLKTYRSDENFIESSRTLSRLLPHAGFLCDAEWHTVVLRVKRANITLTVDGELAYTVEPGFRGDYEEVQIYIGGVDEQENAVAKKQFPYNFKGCIDHISTSEDTFITNYTEVYSENIKSCQPFPPISL